MKAAAAAFAPCTGPSPYGEFCSGPSNGVMVGQTHIPLDGSRNAFVVCCLFGVLVPSLGVFLGITLFLHTNERFG